MTTGIKWIMGKKNNRQYPGRIFIVKRAGNGRYGWWSVRSAVIGCTRRTSEREYGEH